MKKYKYRKKNINLFARTLSKYKVLLAGILFISVFTVNNLYAEAISIPVKSSNTTNVITIEVFDNCGSSMTAAGKEHFYSMGEPAGITILSSGNIELDAGYAFGVIADTIAPSAITTFTVSTTTTFGQIKLEWSAPGDDDWQGTLGIDDGITDDPAQFRIQFATYTSVSWDTSSYNIKIDTYNISPQEIRTALTTLDQETTYYFRIWTRDENTAGNWSDISAGTTKWYRIKPSAITNLTGIAEDDGSVTLQWTAPGDDSNLNDITGGKYRIKWATYTITDWESGIWNDYDDKYSLEFTTNTSPGNTHEKAITGLHGSKAYYFRIWTRDEESGVNYPGNWSYISNAATVTVTDVISISLSTDTYNFGSLAVEASTVSLSAITVTNNSNINELYSIKVDSVTLANGSSSLWVAADTDTGTGYNQFVLYAVFHGTDVALGNFDANDYVVDTSSACSNTKFSDDDGGVYKQTGTNVPKGDNRKLWFRLDMPKTVTTSAEEKITIRIDAAKQ